MRKKIEKLEKFHEGIIAALVSLKKETHYSGEHHYCEIRLVMRGNDIIGEYRSFNYENAVAGVLESLRRELRKKKTTLIRKRKRWGYSTVFS